MADLTRIAQIMAEAVNGPARASLPQRLCVACARALGMDAAAITLMADADQRSGMWASDDRARRVEARQFTLGEGPGVDAFRTRRPVVVADLLSLTEVRWPVLAAVLAQSGPPDGLRAAYAFPLRLGATCIGVLSLYRTAPGTLGADEADDVRAATTAVTLAIVGSFLTVTGEPPAEQWLDDTPLNGVEVDQAIGMVMAQLGVSAEDALDRLRGHAFTHDLEIDEAAHQVVRRQLRFTEDDQ